MTVGVEAVASSMRADLSYEASMTRAHAQRYTDSAIWHLRQRRRQIVQRRRRNRFLGIVGALVVAIGSAIGIAGLTGTDLIGAATARAASLSDLLDQRSPGERTAAQLTKTKHRVLAERSVMAPAPVDLTEVLAPPSSSVLPVDIAAAPEMPAFLAPPPSGGFIVPPEGGADVPPGGPPGGPPGNPPNGPPGGPPDTPPPPPPPAVPEPSTWMTMLVGFAAIGWALRRRQQAPVGRLAISAIAVNRS
jgi:hypothetical protein